MSLANTLASTGRLAEAAEHYHRQLERSRETGDVRDELFGEANLGRLSFRCGNLDEAREHLERAHAGARRFGVAQVEGEALLGLAAVAAVEDPEKAKTLVEESLALHEKHELTAGEAESRLALGRLHLEAGRLEEAEEQFRQAVRLAGEVGEPGTRVLAHCLLARVVATEYRPAEAALAEQAGRLELFLEMEAHNALYRVSGDPARGGAAKKLLARLVENAPAECRPAMLSVIPLHRSIFGP